MRVIFSILLLCAVVTAQAAQVPKYKPSSRFAEPVNIMTNEYGRSRSAPDALQVNAAAPLFQLPRVGGGEVVLAEKLAAGPVVLIFYRGHW